MRQLVTADQMQRLDQLTIEKKQMPGLVLMERAALATREHLAGFDLTRVLVVCGSGNNGGDGIALARLLHLQQVAVSVYLAGNMEHATESCKKQLDIAMGYGVDFVNKLEPCEYTTIVDAIFGVGLSRSIEGNYLEIIQKINDAGVPVLAVDIPSGINSTTGAVEGIAVKAKRTVTFAYEKVGQHLYPGKAYCGELMLCDVGIYGERDRTETGSVCKETTTERHTSYIWAIEETDVRKMIPKRPPEGNKGTFGKALIIAGSKEMSGAAVLTAMAALRMGCGMVKVLTHKDAARAVQCQVPEALLAVYENKAEALLKLKESMEWATVVAVGPGLSTDDTAKALVAEMLRSWHKPLVLDADALNLMAEHRQLLEGLTPQCIVTPHMGEMSRLTGKDMEILKQDCVEACRAFVEQYRCNCIMKDAVTCVGTMDSMKDDASGDVYMYLNTTGNPGMATAGSGDTLTGMTVGLLALGMKPQEAACLAPWIHGYCGDLVAKEKGQHYLLARDITRQLKFLKDWQED